MIPGTDITGGFHKKKDKVRFAKCGKGRLNHITVDFIPGVMDAGGIDEYNLIIVFREDPPDLVSGSLGFM